MARKYDREFKVEAVRLAREEGSTATEVERRLGIGQGMISRWKREFSQQGVDAFGRNRRKGAVSGGEMGVVCA